MLFLFILYYKDAVFVLLSLPGRCGGKDFPISTSYYYLFIIINYLFIHYLRCIPVTCHLSCWEMT